MQYLKYSVIGLLIITSLIILIFALLSKKPLKTLIINALLGLISLAVVDLVSRYTGVYICLNEWTVSASAVLGIPSVLGFVLLQLII